MCHVAEGPLVFRDVQCFILLQSRSTTHSYETVEVEFITITFLLTVPNVMTQLLFTLNDITRTISFRPDIEALLAWKSLHCRSRHSD